MKLTVGVKSAAEASYFLDNGAHELYCGLAGLLNNRQIGRASCRETLWY